VAIDVLSHDDSVYVRRNIAEHSGLAKEAVIRLSEDPDIIVRQRIAMRDDLPVNVRQRLMSDPSQRVRRAAKKQGIRED
jgi:hypothetical protein